MRISVLIGFNPSDGKNGPIASGTPTEVRRLMKAIKLGQEKCKYEEVRYFDQYYQKTKVKKAPKKAKAPKSNGEDKVQEQL